MYNYNYKYHIALSFAEEDRQTAKELWQTLSSKGLRIFYDREHQQRRWEADLTKAWTNVYEKDSQYCLILISENYVTKYLANFKRQFSNLRPDYLIQFQLDDTQVSDILTTNRILDKREKTYPEIVDILIGKLFNPDSVKVFKDPEIGSYHLHIDGSEHINYDLVNTKLMSRDFKEVKEEKIRNSIPGPQRARKPEVYEVHTPEEHNNENFKRLITAEKKDGSISDEDIFELSDLLSNYPGTVIEVEQIVGLMSKEGEWIYDNLTNNFIEIPQSNTIGADCFEVHHQIDIPRKNKFSDIDPLSLEDLLQLSVKTGLNVGGWFLFDKDERWSYRSNSFLPLKTQEHEFLRQYHLFNKSIREYLEPRSLEVSHRMLVERIIRIWKISPIRTSFFPMYNKLDKLPIIS